MRVRKFLVCWLILCLGTVIFGKDNREPRLKSGGPPQVDGPSVLFRFEPPDNSDVSQVYLAGSFNNWANNNDGRIDNPRHAMQRAPSGVWYAYMDLPGERFQYRYVVETTDGNYHWMNDPFVQERDTDGNSAVTLEALGEQAGPAETTSWTKHTLPLAVESVWVRPGETNTLIAKLDDDLADGTQLRTTITTPFGETIHQATQAAHTGVNRIKLPGFAQSGGYVARVEMIRNGEVSASGQTILSVLKNVADDLRYGFYATYPDEQANYDAKAAMLADLHINAVEFYDYFPAHGDYAPEEPAYRFEPFDVAINALDVKAKIEAGHRRSILAIAYIAAYAASESIYRAVTDPMTDAGGSPKVFNGYITTEAEADRKGQQKWFWLMNIARGSDWHRYILAELEQALREDGDDYVAFDGFEIDTYGDSREARFHAPGSPRDGDRLAEVLQDYVEDVTTLTHEIKPQGLVSFNSVNEFGVENMYSVTDFLFLEIWRTYASRLSALIDICYYHRQARNQRVVLKLYPADMQPTRTSWPHVTLARVLGATMTGGGSLMVAGEPDDATGTMHALNSLYYPDHQPMSQENEALLRRYYQHDALLYRYTHGSDVQNLPLRVPVEGCITRAFQAPDHSAITVQLLHVGNDPDWAAVPAYFPARSKVTLTIPLPSGLKPEAIYYTTPDSPEYQLPQALPFEFERGQVRLTLPELQVHGSVIIRYREAS